MTLRILIEGWLSAWYELRNNKLRAFLSLLGISIGIICIISVLSSVDSLKVNIKGSLSSLGNDVLYIQKWPWMPENGEVYKWWDFYKRPVSNPSELKLLKEKIKSAEGAALMIFIENQIAKHKQSESKNTCPTGITQDYSIIRNMNFTEGRYFTDVEFEAGRNIVIIGDAVAQDLFYNVPSPIGQEVEILNKKYTVVGVLEKEGKDLLGFTQDNILLVPYNSLQTALNTEKYEPFIALKAKEGVNIEDLKIEIKGQMRKIRKLKPKDKDNFSFNQVSLLSDSLESLFILLNLAAVIIGGFSILVGAFGVANIMYVSVKERESQIGIKKALGAKRIFILTEFLIEAVMLCVLGGLIGLVIVYALFAGLSSMMESMDVGLKLFIAPKFVVWGLIISILTGMIAGLKPAMTASKLNPVDAMRG
jgi:putative ABC transport system permease protein